MRSRRKVTLTPICMSSRSLKVAIDACARDHHRMLAGDRGQIVGRGVDLLAVLHRLADAHVDDDLVEPRHLHRVLVAELLHQRRADRRLVALLQPGRHLGSLTCRSTSPERRANRTLRPSSRIL